MTDTTKITVVNGGKRAEGLHASDGKLIWVQPGHQRTVTVFDHHAKALGRIKNLKIEATALAAPVAEPEPEPETTSADDAKPEDKADGDMIAALADPELVPAIDDADLRDFIERKTGQKPHHALGRAKLVEQATALAAPVA